MGSKPGAGRSGLLTGQIFFPLRDDSQTDRSIPWAGFHSWQSVRPCWKTDSSTCYTVSHVDQAQKWMGCLLCQRIAQIHVNRRWWWESGILSSVPMLSEYSVFSRFFQMSPFLVFFFSPPAFFVRLLSFFMLLTPPILFTFLILVSAHRFQSLFQCPLSCGFFFFGSLPDLHFASLHLRWLPGRCLWHDIYSHPFLHFLVHFPCQLSVSDLSWKDVQSWGKDGTYGVYLHIGTEREWSMLSEERIFEVVALMC